MQPLTQAVDVELLLTWQLYKTQDLRQQSFAHALFLFYLCSCKNVPWSEAQCIVAGVDDIVKCTCELVHMMHTNKMSCICY